jgi:hypothetical protein
LAGVIERASTLAAVGAAGRRILHGWRLGIGMGEDVSHLIDE